MQSDYHAREYCPRAARAIRQSPIGSRPESRSKSSDTWSARHELYLWSGRGRSGPESWCRDASTYPRGSIPCAPTTCRRSASADRLLVGKLMVNAVCGDPENRSTFERQRRAPGKEILHPLRSLVSAMGQQAVIAHTDAKAARYPPQENSDEECRPGEEK